MSATAKDQHITIRFPSDVLAVMRELAKAHERSFNGEVLWALRTYIALQKEKPSADQKDV
jgi:hypothetical protein